MARPRVNLAQASRGMCSLDEIAATVPAAVIGHNRAGNSLIQHARAVGRLRASLLRVTQVHQEHGTVSAPDPGWFDRLRIGARVRIMPNHPFMTCAAYVVYHVIGGQRVIDTR